MLSQANILLCLLVLTADASSGRRRGYYTVVAPLYFFKTSPYYVSVSLGDFHKSAWFNISILDGNDHIVRQTVEVQPRTTELISLQVPKFDSKDLVLETEGFRGIISRKFAVLFPIEFSHQVDIQTDKPKYRPGDLVQFRVICFDEFTRLAVTDESLDVMIYDNDNNLVKTMKDVKLTHGVFKGQQQLADNTLLGTWKIQVKSNGAPINKKVFWVSRYILPRFTVQIVTKTDVFVNDDEIEIIFTAKYAHDLPVMGNLLVKFTLNKLVRSSTPLSISRKTQFHGVQHISLNLERDLNMRKIDVKGTRTMLYSLRVDVRVTDSMTEQIVDATFIKFYSSPYIIKLKVSDYFDPLEPVDVRVSVTDLQDQPVKATGSPVEIRMRTVGLMTEDDSQTIYLNEEGVGVAQLHLTHTDYSLLAQPKVGEEIVVQLTSRDPIDHFVYELVSRGNIFQAERINVPKEATTYQLRMITTRAMVPEISLYVHRIKEGKYLSDQKQIVIGRAFQNSIKIDVEREVVPGASVSVNVSTDEDSYVGLMAVDKRLLLPSGQLIALDEYMADERSLVPLITLSNSLPGGDSVVFGSFAERKQPEPFSFRHIFSDGWLFDDFEKTPKGGLRLHPTIPDAITSWAITGFSLNPHTGLSLTENDATVRVFQSFFISMDLPSVVREGEILEVPVYVFNNNNKDAMTEVTIESHSQHLVLLDSLSMDATPSSNITYFISISAQGRVMSTFPIKPLKSGLFNVTVRATSPIGSDAVRKTLTVVSEGIPHMVSKTYLVHFLHESEQTDELLVNIPENAVQSSEQIELSVVGDTFGPLVESLSNLVQVPYGNGKETTMHFISNLLVLKYLKTFNVTNLSMERKALSFLELGYQGLLTLRHLDGSFSFFERSTKTTGDALQTAIVIWALQDARNFIQIIRKKRRQSLDYLKLKQEPNGGFRSGNSLEDDVALTSFTLLAFMKDKGNADIISRGLAFLYNSLDDLQSPTSAALSKYVLVVGRHEKSQQILSQLSSRSARIRTGRRVLCKSTTMQGILEATSGSFLSILQSQVKPTDTLIPIVTALLSPGHSDKIPTHMMALDVMIGIARDMRFGTRNLHIHFESDRGDAGDLKVNSNNVHVLQTIQLNSATRKVRIATKGEGLAVVTIKSTYNVHRENLTTLAFQTNVTVSEEAEAIMLLKVCVSTRVAGGAGNFTAVEVSLPSGYTILDQEDNPFNSHFGKYETNKWFGTQAKGISPKLRAFKVDSATGSVHSIFEDIDQLGACLDLSALRAFKVLNAKVVSVVVYDVYDDGQRSTTWHELV